MRFTCFGLRRGLPHRDAKASLTKRRASAQESQSLSVATERSYMDWIRKD